MTSSKLRIAPGLSLPLDIITMRSLVLGVSGSGKSTFGRLLAEKVHEAGQRFCVIDLKNDWWGLKSSADGRSPAIPVVIIGGPRADIPLDPDAGAAVADIIAELPHSFVLDLDQLSKGKGIRFLGVFLERLYDVNREPLLLVGDEFDRYGPQKPMTPEAHVTLGAVDDVARRGRKRGLGLLVLSQRPAVVNKNITSQCELVVTFRTTSSLDQKELREHIGRVSSADQVDETMRTVGGLRNGEAIFTSQHPDLRLFATVQLPMPVTFDSSATPKVGERRIEPRELAAPDLAALGERIKATVEKAKAEDPKALQRRVRELEAELKQARAVVTHDPAALEQARAAERADAFREFQRDHATAVDGLKDSIRVYVDAILNVVDGHNSKLAPVPPPAPKAHGRMPMVPPPPQQRATPPGPRGGGHSNGLPVMHRKFLTALAQHPKGLTKGQILTHTGYASAGATSRAFATLSSEGLISCDHLVTITDAGMEKLGPFDPLPVGDELRDHLLQTLPKMEATLLRVVFDHHPATIGKGEILNRAGYSSAGATSRAFARLTRLGYVVRRGHGLTAAPEMFE